MICIFLVYFLPYNVSAGITFLACTIWMLMNARASKEFVCFTIYFATCLSLRFSNSFNTPLFILEHKRTFVARAWDWIQLPLSLFPHPCLANLVSTSSEWLSWLQLPFFFFFKFFLHVAAHCQKNRVSVQRRRNVILSWKFEFQMHFCYKLCRLLC